MKNVMFTLVLMLAICTSGCLEMVTTSQVDTLTDNTKLFMSKVDDYQAVANKAFALAERDGAISAKTLAYTVNLSNDVNTFKPQLSGIVKAVDEAADDPASKAEAGLLAARHLIPAPYGELALFGVGIWKALGINRKRKDDIAMAKESGKRRSEKAGTEKTIRELAAMPVEEITADVVKSKLFDNIGTERARNGFT